MLVFNKRQLAMHSSLLVCRRELLYKGRNDYVHDEGTNYLKWAWSHHEEDLVFFARTKFMLAEMGKVSGRKIKFHSCLSSRIDPMTSISML